jgi:hypothetical protein
MSSNGARMWILLGAALVMSATVTARAQNAQQQRMTNCNAEAKSRNIAGDNRKQFMKTCLSAGGTSHAVNTQQQKMKTCNAQANGKALKGKERKQFMSECLKGG